MILGLWDVGIFLISAFLVVLDLWIFNFGIMGLLKRCHLLPVSGDWRGKGKVSYVTVSGVWKGLGKGVTCNGFWAWGGTKEKVSHVTVSGALEGSGKRCHM